MVPTRLYDERHRGPAEFLLVVSGSPSYISRVETRQTRYLPTCLERSVGRPSSHMGTPGHQTDMCGPRHRTRRMGSWESDRIGQVRFKARIRGLYLWPPIQSRQGSPC